jgi:di/tricarboxylate transporter
VPGDILTLIVVAIMFLALVSEIFEPVLIFFIALVILMSFGIIDIQEAVDGFSNPGVMTIAALFVVAGTVQKSPYMFNFLNKNFGDSYEGDKSMLKFMIPVTLFSALMNNTPIVSLFIPLVRDWCRKVNISPSKFLIPLSYTSIFGGMLTLIGTSTNLVVSGMMESHGYEPLGMFQITKVSIFLVIAGTFYLIIFGYKILPDNKDTINRVKKNSREYLVRFYVEDSSPIAGKTVEQASLRNLDGLYLVEIKRREKKTIVPVERGELIRGGDILVFTGRIDTLAQLQAIEGLKIHYTSKFDMEDLKNGTAEIIEAVISESFPFLHGTIKETHFSNYYDGAVIAVIRNGDRLKLKIGDIKLQPGDTILLLAKKGFEEKWGDTKDFYLMASHVTENYLIKERAWIPLVSFGVTVVLSAFNIVPILHASFIGISLLFITKTVEPRECLKIIDWPTIIVIAFSFGIGEAMIGSGAASLIAVKLIDITKGMNGYGALAIIYIMTNILTELITNNAAAILAFPIALEVSRSLGISHLPFSIAVAIAATSSFSSPYGYQTNLMVYGPGGYRYKDFIKIGLPLNILFMIISVILIPIFYPFNN